jgi:hypothetical protein
MGGLLSDMFNGDGTGLADDEVPHSDTRSGLGDKQSDEHEDYRYERFQEVLI